jgi:hypothetical protein
MVRRLILFFILFFLHPVFGFGFTEGDSLLLKGVSQISLTRQGQILAATNQSAIFLLDSTGKVLYQFSPRRPARIHLLEGWNGLRIFAFYRDFQEYVMLDRFLLSDGPVPLDPEKTGYARLLAPSLDGNLWVLDESSFQLKKIEIQSQKTLFSTPLDLVLTGKQYELSFMREYQNQLYLADRLGRVLVFDQMGNFRKKLPLEKCGWLGFRGEEIYTLENDSLAFFHPFLLKKRKLALPSGAAGAEKVLITGNSLFFLRNENLYRMECPEELR